MRYWLRAIIAFFILCNSYAAIAHIDSLKNVLHTAQIKADVSKTNEIYVALTHTFSKVNSYDSTIKYAYLALPFYKKMENNKIIADLFKELGSAFITKAVYDSATICLQKSIEQYGLIGDSVSISANLGGLGMINTKTGNFEKATDYALKSLNLAERLNAVEQIAWSSNLLGSIYWYLMEDKKALEYYQQALKHYKQLNDSFGIAKANINIGGYYQEYEQPKKAIEYYEDGLKAFQQIKEKRGICATMSNLGSVYFSIENFTKSIYYLEKTLTLSEELGDLWRNGTTLNRLGLNYFHLGNYKKAREQFTEALINAEEINAFTIMRDSYKNLALTDSATGNYFGAYTNYIKYSQIKDSIFNAKSNKQITEMQTKYETQKKEKEIALLNKEKELKEKELTIQKTALLSVVVIAILLIFSVFLLNRRIKEKQRTNNLLSDKNREIEEKQSRIEEQNKKLENQAKQLQELDELKSRFFTNISHEFRTPLTLIIGPLEQLLSTVKESKIKQQIQLMLRNAKGLLGLINQLLDISKIEKGSMKLQLQELDVAKELAYLLEMFRSRAKEKDVVLEFEIPEKIINGFIDREKFERIIINLLSNAIKHTQKGSITINLKPIDSAQFKITITDTGKGISPEDLPHIFDRFYQTASVSTDGSGTGIGLAYTKELVQVCKGSISVQSELKKGSVFKIELPTKLETFKESEYELVRDWAEKQIVEEPIEQSQDTGLEQPKANHKETILVVEDHEDLRKFIVQNLEPYYNVLEAENGKIGIDTAIDESPNLIITDIMMPEVSGIELTQTLKKHEQTSHIPIVMLTAKSSVESKLEGLESEADDYLTKPFNVQELLVRIKNLLSVRRKLQEKYNKSITINPSEITTTSVDEQFLTKALKAVEENMANTDFSVEVLCDLIGMSRANLHKKLKSLVNQSATEFINTIRLKRAAQLIQQKSANVSEIAYEVGFNNLSYFSRAFKKQFNKTPKEMLEEAGK